jgi:hypothetical protein
MRLLVGFAPKVVAEYNELLSLTLYYITDHLHTLNNDEKIQIQADS